MPAMALAKRPMIELGLHAHDRRSASARGREARRMERDGEVIHAAFPVQPDRCLDLGFAVLVAADDRSATAAAERSPT
jgi:hypothetical protein